MVRPLMWRFVVILTTSLTVASAADDEISLGRLVAQPTPLALCNTSSDDYGPSFDPISHSLVFTSERSGKAAIYQCSMKEGSLASPFSGTFNNDHEQRAFIAVAKDGDAVGIAYQGYEEQSYPGIVTVTRDDGRLNLGHPIAAVSGPFFVSHPAISPDGSRLVFTTDRDGGEGGLDLWISERRDDRSWSSPINLGRSINSERDDVSPTFLSSDTLVFASNGVGGKGGLDIFYSVFRNGAWQEPVPLDWLNSEFDDSDCFVMEDGSQVFASNRPGGSGGLDLWVAKRVVNGE
ncbi:MAG: hypothetical protein NTX15_02865 [Candidatus Kapabacteria bacterium]|nr:hypothetical protein [Candidatus Kapabacteria bacterium]